MKSLLPRLHAAAAMTALACIAAFWLSTVLLELFAGPEAVAAVKNAILWGMAVLVPAMAVTGTTGARLARRRKGPVIATKRARMKAIAANGLVVLVPSAVFLALRADAGNFDMTFYAVQALELVAGAVNFTLMALNARAGRNLRPRLRTA